MSILPKPPVPETEVVQQAYQGLIEGRLLPGCRSLLDKRKLGEWCEGPVHHMKVADPSIELKAELSFSASTFHVCGPQTTQLYGT